MDFLDKFDEAGKTNDNDNTYDDTTIENIFINLKIYDVIKLNYKCSKSFAESNILQFINYEE